MAQGELGSAQAALAQSQQEYEQYKVSGQTVLPHVYTPSIVDLIIHNNNIIIVWFYFLRWEFIVYWNRSRLPQLSQISATS